MQKKLFRKTIRINGRQIVKRFRTKALADRWYHKMSADKEAGLNGFVNTSETLESYFDNEWFPQRQRSHRPATHKPDQQRFNDYVRPVLGNFKMAMIKANHVRALLLDLTEKNGLSPQTRNRVRALLSIMFNDALNRSIPLVGSNPVSGIRFKGKRVAEYTPSFLETSEDCLEFIRTAKSINENHLLVASILIMAGLRKQELIALKWSSVDFENRLIKIKDKYLQAEKIIITGTKKGENVTRYVPISTSLADLLHRVFHSRPDAALDDFILSKPDGSHYSPKQIYEMVVRIGCKANLKVTVHGLRHTFGRSFAERSPNMKALQDILGHSSMSTTEIYSKLGKGRLRAFAETVSFEIDTEGQEST